MLRVHMELSLLRLCLEVFINQQIQYRIAKEAELWFDLGVKIGDSKKEGAHF